MPSVDAINQLARELHGSDAAASGFTLDSLAEHVGEVRGLLAAGDPHWKAETVDIIIHGLTLLRRGAVDEEEYRALMDRRLMRFREKISAANKREQIHG